jgi:mRNA interferase HigB
MRIITYLRIKEFSTKHNDAKSSLDIWYQIVKNKEWTNLSDIKNDFKSVDYVGNFRYVFDIKGNKYRIVCIISFNAKKVYIRFIGTHSEYDKITDIKNI